MPIQFQCPHCRHAMQLPDTAAGKQGKCPKCSNAVTVPAARAAAPPNPHDEEFWSGVGDKKKDTAPSEADPHKSEKRSDAQILKHILGKAEAAKEVKRIGVPWERPRDGGMFDRYWDTAIGVMNHTKDTFNEMRITGGIGSPFKFMILGSTLGSLIAAVYGLIGNAIALISASGILDKLADDAVAEGGEAVAVATGTGVTVEMVITVVLLFFGSFVGGIIGGIIHTFLQSAALQLALPMVGVKQASFEKNFRVVAFTNGSIYLCNIVPGLGLAFMLFLWFNGMIKGLESVYEVPTNTAVFAVLLLFVPLVLPIVAVVGLLAMMMLGYIG